MSYRERKAAQRKERRQQRLNFFLSVMSIVGFAVFFMILGDMINILRLLI